MKRPLTLLAQQAVAQVLRPGDLAIDATAGNGHDTVFLARQVGLQGKVYAFDIQPQALRNTAQRLRQHDVQATVQLIQAGHQQLDQYLPPSLPAPLSAAMFNLGYLPGSDKQVTTGAPGTLEALDKILQRLAPGGIISILAYRGHPGGKAETQAIEDWLDAHAHELELEVFDSPGPILFLIRTHAP